jgi:hypothetical protein
MLVEALRGSAKLPERKLTEPESVPALADLAKLGKMQKGAGA